MQVCIVIDNFCSYKNGSSFAATKSIVAKTNQAKDHICLPFLQLQFKQPAVVSNWVPFNQVIISQEAVFHPKKSTLQEKERKKNKIKWPPVFAFIIYIYMLLCRCKSNLLLCPSGYCSNQVIFSLESAPLQLQGFSK